MANQEIIFFNQSVRKMRTSKANKINFPDDFVDFVIYELTLIHEENKNRILKDSNYCNEARTNKAESAKNLYICKGEENGEK